MLDAAFLATLAFLDSLGKAGAQPSPAVVPPPGPMPYVPPVAPAVVPAVTPAPFKIPPPGVLPQFEQPPAPVPPPPSPPPLPVPVEPPTPPGPGPVLPPWNAGITPCPADSPPFPGPGWVPDTPVSTAVAARATYWNPILWDYSSKTIAHAAVCEQFGGRWMTFAAAWHPGDQGPQTYMAVEAWRLATDQPLPAPPPPPAPAPTPVGPQPAPTPVVVQTPVQAAAVAMTNALNAHGYKLADQPLYKQFQTLAKTTADGFPGTGTMALLKSVLSSMSPPLPMPNVPIYPWKAAPGYDGVNAPTLQQWTGQAPGPVVVTPGQAVPTPSVSPPSGPPLPVQPYPGTGAWQTNSAYIARYQAALMFLGYSVGPTGADGKYGPNTAAAVKAFQADHGLTQDSEAGAATAAALDAATSAPSAAA